MKKQEALLLHREPLVANNKTFKGSGDTMTKSTRHRLRRQNRRTDKHGNEIVVPYYGLFSSPELRFL